MYRFPTVTQTILLTSIIPVAYFFLPKQKYFEKIPVSSISKETHNTLRICVEKSFKDAVPFHIIIKDDSCEIGREYSPITINEKTFLIIKLYQNGTLSRIFKDLKQGDLLTTSLKTFPSGPGNSVLNLDGNLNLIGGGTGITPLFQIIQEKLNSSVDKVHLFYINKTEGDILLRKELEELARIYKDRFIITFAVNCRNLLPDLITSPNVAQGFEKFNLNKSFKTIVCGPEGFSELVCGNKLIGFDDVVKLKS